MPSTNHANLLTAGSPAQAIRARHRRARIGLIRAREDLGLSRPAMGEKIGMSRFSIFRIEMGYTTPSMAMMCRWVDALGPGAGLDLFRLAE
jgi:DNA-binding XRE family transcriptional regulator